jgi:large subunit ribosomal protein L18
MIYMAHGPRYRVPRKRRREGKTDYRRRLSLLKSHLPRAVVRKSQKNVLVQFIVFDPKGDKVISTTSGYELVKFGWKGSTSNIPSAYLTGYLAGKRAKEMGIVEAVLDIGLATPQKGSKVFASLKGMVDSGLDIPHNEKILPSEERIRGEHINDSIKNQFEQVKTKLEGAK